AVSDALSSRTGVFGVSAGIVDGGKVKMLHQMEVVSSDIEHSVDRLLEIMVALSRKNPSTKSGLCSLPMPQYLADRTAGELRSWLFEDTALRNHLFAFHKNDLDAAGGYTAYLYRTLRKYILENENGWTWAI